MNDDMYQRILEEKEAHEKELLQLDGVHGVGIGFKVKDGKPTEELAIVVLTTEKKGRNALSQDQMIPSVYNGIITDVVEMPEIRLIPMKPEEKNARNALGADSKKYRPIPGGVEIAMPMEPPYVGLGTAGMFARSIKSGDSINDVYILSNAHCFSNPSPNVLQGGEKVATVARTAFSELVDGGIAKLDDPINADLLKIQDIGRPCGSYAVTMSDLNAAVIKRGRTTEVTTGEIQYIEFSANDKKHQILIKGAAGISDGGDSGSVVLMKGGNHDGYVIGLLWGGIRDAGIAVLSPITAVEKELQIQLCARPYGITYTAHTQTLGWMGYVAEGQIAGTTGQKRRLEAVKIKLVDCSIPSARIKYRVHVQTKGWLPYVYDDQVAGTTGEARRAEAIQIELENLPEYSVVYRAHMQNKGWSAWVRDGAVAGTTGEARRIEAIQVFIVKK